MKIGLIACSKRKQDYRCPVWRMYSKSALFRSALAYCRKHYDRIYILSAKYGLLGPENIIDPYDVSLGQMSVGERKEWAKKVTAQLKKILKKGDHVYFHAGAKYREVLIPLLENKCFVPLVGMGIGKQLRFYNLRMRKLSKLQGAKRRHKKHRKPNP